MEKVFKKLRFVNYTKLHINELETLALIIHENLVDKTAILVRLVNSKQWIRHEAFGKIYMILYIQGQLLQSIHSGLILNVNFKLVVLNMI